VEKRAEKRVEEPGRNCGKECGSAGPAGWGGSPGGQAVRTGSARTPVVIGDGMNAGGTSGSTRRRGNRSSRMSSAIRPSSPAGGAPT